MSGFVDSIDLGLCNDYDYTRLYMHHHHDAAILPYTCIPPLQV